MNNQSAVMEEALKCVEKLDYDKAKVILENSLKINECNTEMLDLYGEVLINLDLTNQAIIVNLFFYERFSTNRLALNQ